MDPDDMIINPELFELLYNEIKKFLPDKNEQKKILKEEC